MSRRVWPGSARAEGWTRRRDARATFEHMAEMCADIAAALDTHRDTDAQAIFERLREKTDAAGKMPCFETLTGRRK